MDNQEFKKMVWEGQVSALEMLIKEERKCIRFELLIFLGLTAAIIFMFIAYKKTFSVLAVFNAGMFFSQLIWTASGIMRSRRRLRRFNERYKQLRIGNDWKPSIPNHLEN